MKNHIVTILLLCFVTHIGKVYSKNKEIFNREDIVDTIPVLIRYSGGMVKDSGTALKMVDGRFVKNGVWKTYHSNGLLKDSSFFLNASVSGERKVYYLNGRIKLHIVVSTYGDDSLQFISGKKYRRNGSLKTEGCLLDGNVFGEMRKYRFGKLCYYYDMHKGKMVSVQSAYKNGRHISDNHFIDNIKTRNAVLKAGGKSKKLKNGTLIKIGIKNTSTPLTHCLVEGFSETEIYVSRFSYDMSPNLCALQFDSLAVIKFEDIEYLESSWKRPNVPLNIARGFCGTGILLFVEPILIPPLIGHPEGVVSREMLPFYTAAIILFIPGKILYRLTVPKKYNIGKQWKIELKK